MNSTSYIEISKSALQENIIFLQSLIGPDVKLSSVIKGNAYGHGIEPFSRMAYDCGIRHFSVYSVDEAFRLKNALKDSEFNKIEVMILGGVHDQDSLEWVIQNNISFYVFELKQLYDAVDVVQNVVSDRKARIHLEVETGMNRTGLGNSNLIKAREFITVNRDHIIFEGLCTHFAGAESVANHFRIQKQIRRYAEIKKSFIKAGLEPQYYHTSCSAATVVYRGQRHDLVRIGIMQYGLWPSPETFIHFVGKKIDLPDPLIRVISWKSKVTSVKSVKVGEFIGYGTSYLARDNMKIAIVPVGYSQGYTRSLSNQGRILIRGERVGIVGTINMNMLIADVSDLETIEIGDEVVLIGKQGERTITVSSFSEYSDQLNYEMLTRLPETIERKMVP